MSSNRNVRRVFLTAAIVFEIFLGLASTVYLNVASFSFLLVIVALLLSIVGIVILTREIDRHDSQTIYR